MTERVVDRFENHVDSPEVELWTFRVMSDRHGAELKIDEAHRDHPFDIVLGADEAAAFSAFMRAAPARGDSALQSVDRRNGEWAYFRVGSGSDGRWALMFSRRGGDVELVVDEQTMRAIVEAVIGAIGPS